VAVVVVVFVVVMDVMVVQFNSVFKHKHRVILIKLNNALTR
jgi:hypothetical protein